MVSKLPHRTINSLKEALEKAWRRFPMRVLRKVIDSFPKRLRQCIKAGGKRFE